jgi:hypothetical protein
VLHLMPGEQNHHQGKPEQIGSQSTYGILAASICRLKNLIDGVENLLNLRGEI